ncbi:MAG: Txe/YoeB family addiction module toxin [Burkholderiales bacterium]
MARDRLPAPQSRQRRSPGEGGAGSRGRQGRAVQPAPASVEWAPQAFADYERWRKIQPALAKKIDALIADIFRSPFAGIGKPEPLKRNLSGSWSRRVTHEHRLVYRYESGLLRILSCRYHY